MEEAPRSGAVLLLEGRCSFTASLRLPDVCNERCAAQRCSAADGECWFFTPCRGVVYLLCPADVLYDVRFFWAHHGEGLEPRTSSLWAGAAPHCMFVPAFEVEPLPPPRPCPRHRRRLSDQNLMLAVYARRRRRAVLGCPLAYIHMGLDVDAATLLALAVLRIAIAPGARAPWDTYINQV